MTKKTNSSSVSVFVPRYLNEEYGVRTIRYYRGQIVLMVARPKLHLFAPYKFWYERTIDVPEGYLLLHLSVVEYIRFLHNLFYYEKTQIFEDETSNGQSLT